MLLDRTWKSIYKRISWTWLPVIGLNRLYRKIRQVMKCNSAHKFCSISVFFFWLLYQVRPICVGSAMQPTEVEIEFNKRKTFDRNLAKKNIVRFVFSKFKGTA